MPTCRVHEKTLVFEHFDIDLLFVRNGKWLDTSIRVSATSKFISELIPFGFGILISGSILTRWSMGFTGDEPFKSICRILGPRAKKPTLGVQHAVEAGYLKSMLLFVLLF